MPIESRGASVKNHSRGVDAGILERVGLAGERVKHFLGTRATPKGGFENVTR